MTRLFCLLLILVTGSGVARGGEPEVIDIVTERDAGGEYRFIVTINHADTGWEHYADAWDVLTPDGVIVATRILHHPHVNEMPFTRSLAGIVLPMGTGEVMIRPRCSVDGHGPSTQVSIP